MTTQTSTLTCNYIGVCSPDYLSDHHNRDNQVLLCGNPSWSKTLLAQSLSEAIPYNDALLELFSDQEINQAIQEMVSGLFLWEQLPEIDGVVVDEEDIPEDICVYAYLSW